MKKLTKQNLEELAQQMAVIDTATQAKFIGGGDGTWGNPWTAEEYYNSDVNAIIGGWVVIGGITDYMCPGVGCVAGITNPMARTAVQYLDINERDHSSTIQLFWDRLKEHYGTDKYDDYAKNNESWCAAFVAYACLENGYSVPNLAEGVRFWNDYGISVSSVEVKAGDIAIFKHSHIGIVGDVRGDEVYVIHANTNVDMGDIHGVSSKWIKKSELKKFRRPQ